MTLCPPANSASPLRRGGNVPEKASRRTSRFWQKLNQLIQSARLELMQRNPRKRCAFAEVLCTLLRETYKDPKLGPPVCGVHNALLCWVRESFTHVPSPITLARERTRKQRHRGLLTLRGQKLTRYKALHLPSPMERNHAGSGYVRRGKCGPLSWVTCLHENQRRNPKSRR